MNELIPKTLKNHTDLIQGIGERLQDHQKRLTVIETSNKMDAKLDILIKSIQDIPDKMSERISELEMKLQNNTNTENDRIPDEITRHEILEKMNAMDKKVDAAIENMDKMGTSIQNIRVAQQRTQGNGLVKMLMDKLDDLANILEKLKMESCKETDGRSATHSQDTTESIDNMELKSKGAKSVDVRLDLLINEFTYSLVKFDELNDSLKELRKTVEENDKHIIYAIKDVSRQTNDAARNEIAKNAGEMRKTVKTISEGITQMNTKLDTTNNVDIGQKLDLVVRDMASFRNEQVAMVKSNGTVEHSRNMALQAKLKNVLEETNSLKNQHQETLDAINRGLDTTTQIDTKLEGIVNKQLMQIQQRQKGSEKRFEELLEEIGLNTTSTSDGIGNFHKKLEQVKKNQFNKKLDEILVKTQNGQQESQIFRTDLAQRAKKIEEGLDSLISKNQEDGGNDTVNQEDMLVLMSNLSESLEGFNRLQNNKRIDSKALQRIAKNQDTQISAHNLVAANVASIMGMLKDHTKVQERLFYAFNDAHLNEKLSAIIEKLTSIHLLVTVENNARSNLIRTIQSTKTGEVIGKIGNSSNQQSGMEENEVLRCVDSKGQIRVLRVKRRVETNQTSAKRPKLDEPETSKQVNCTEESGKIEDDVKEPLTLKCYNANCDFEFHEPYAYGADGVSSECKNKDCKMPNIIQQYSNSGEKWMRSYCGSELHFQLLPTITSRHGKCQVCHEETTFYEAGRMKARQVNADKEASPSNLAAVEVLKNGVNDQHYKCWNSNCNFVFTNDRQLADDGVSTNCPREDCNVRNIIGDLKKGNIWVYTCCDKGVHYQQVNGITSYGKKIICQVCGSVGSCYGANDQTAIPI